MLAFIRRSAASFITWLILGVIALAFGLSFGLPSDTIFTNNTTVTKALGENLDDIDYRYQANLLGQSIPDDPKLQQMMGVIPRILDAMLERKILAKLARDLGLAATQEDAEELTLNGHIIVNTRTQSWLGDRGFDYSLFKNGLLPNLGITEARYLATQTDELLGRTLSDLLHSALILSPAELRDIYDQNATTVSLRYVRFASTSESSRLAIPEAEITAYLDKHREDLDQSYARQGARFLKLPKQAKLRLIELAKGATEMQAKLARARAEKALARLRAGEDFAKIATEFSANTATRNQGGSYGWVSESSGTGFDPVVGEALRSIAPSQLSGILDGAQNLYILRVDDRREGDVPKDKALRELAEEALQLAHRREKAKARAEAFLPQLNAGKTLAVLFKPEQLELTPPFRRDDSIPGIGDAPELLRSAFAASPDKPFLPQIFESGDDFFLAALESVDLATDEGFAQIRFDLERGLGTQKSELLLQQLAKHECLAALERKLITPMDKTIRRLQGQGGDGAGKPYTPCETLGTPAALF